MLSTPRVHCLSEPVPRPPDLSPLPTNIQVGAAQRRFNPATLRSRRQPDSHSDQHTVNFGPNDIQTAFGFGTVGFKAREYLTARLPLATSRPLARHSQDSCSPATCSLQTRHSLGAFESGTPITSHHRPRRGTGQAQTSASSSTHQT